MAVLVAVASDVVGKSMTWMVGVSVRGAAAAAAPNSPSRRMAAYCSGISCSAATANAASR